MKLNATLKAGTKYRYETEGEKLSRFMTLRSDAQVEVVAWSDTEDADDFSIYAYDGRWIYVRNCDDV